MLCLLCYTLMGRLCSECSDISTGATDADAVRGQRLELDLFAQCGALRGMSISRCLHPTLAYCFERDDDRECLLPPYPNCSPFPPFLAALSLLLCSSNRCPCLLFRSRVAALLLSCCITLARKRTTLISWTFVPIALCPYTIQIQVFFHDCKETNELRQCSKRLVRAHLHC